jgi:enterochelin esterase-like enzyme
MSHPSPAGLAHHAARVPHHTSPRTPALHRPATLAPGPSLPEDVRRQLAHPGTLESPWVWVVLAGVAVLAAACLVWWWRRHPATGWPGWAARATGCLAVLLLAGSAGALGVNSYVGYFPSVGSVAGYLTGGHDGGLGGSGGGTAAGGHFPSRVVADRLSAPRLGVRPGRLYVYLPPGYDDPANAGRRYPVVYLLHGYPGRAADWFTAGQAGTAMDLLVSRHLVPPMILASPDAAAGRGLYDSECLNAVGGPAEDTFLTGTVVSWVDGHYRTIRDRSARAIGGMSSGGYCALNLGLRHTDRFSVILAMQPYGDPGRAGYAHLDWRRPLMAANTPSGYIRTMRFLHRMAVMLDAPQDDPGGVAAARTLGLALAERGQQVAFRVEDGQSHTWHEARVGLPYLLAYAGSHLRAADPVRSPHAWEVACETHGAVRTGAAQGREPGRGNPERSAGPAGRPGLLGADNGRSGGTCPGRKGDNLPALAG